MEDVSVILRTSDIYVLPNDEEGFGTALAETMACGLVCVATKTVGPSAIIKGALNGFLTDLIYDRVLRGLDQALRLDYANAKDRKPGRQRIVDNFRRRNCCQGSWIHGDQFSDGDIAVIPSCFPGQSMDISGEIGNCLVAAFLHSATNFRSKRCPAGWHAEK